MLKMKNQKKDKQHKLLIKPILTFFFYAHSPGEYNRLWEEYRRELIRYLKYNGEFQTYYEKNKNRADARLLQMAEKKWPTPYCWNDIGGFIAIRIENPVEGFRVIGEVWSIKNRRFRKKRIFNMEYGVMEIVDKKLLSKPKEFNKKFFKIVEKIITRIDKEFLKKKRFYFSLEDNQVNWDLIKTTDVAKFLKELGPDWIY